MLSETDCCAVTACQAISAFFRNTCKHRDRRKGRSNKGKMLVWRRTVNTYTCPNLSGSLKSRKKKTGHSHTTSLRESTHSDLFRKPNHWRLLWWPELPCPSSSSPLAFREPHLFWADFLKTRSLMWNSEYKIEKPIWLKATERSNDGARDGEKERVKENIGSLFQMTAVSFRPWGRRTSHLYF